MPFKLRAIGLASAMFMLAAFGSSVSNVAPATATLQATTVPLR
jgi:hypothetical protein